MIAARSCILASIKLHRWLLSNLMRNPMWFYDSTPLGRILNRAGKDMDVVDNLLPSNFRMLLYCICVVITEASWVGFFFITWDFSLSRLKSIRCVFYISVILCGIFFSVLESIVCLFIFLVVIFIFEKSSWEILSFFHMYQSSFWTEVSVKFFIIVLYIYLLL